MSTTEILRLVCYRLRTAILDFSFPYLTVWAFICPTDEQMSSCPTEPVDITNSVEQLDPVNIGLAVRSVLLSNLEVEI